MTDIDEVAHWVLTIHRTLGPRIKAIDTNLKALQHDVQELHKVSVKLTTLAADSKAKSAGATNES